jgi:hypothetical protein
MTNRSVYYINIKPYLHDLKFEEVLKRFMESTVGEKIMKNDNHFNFKAHMMTEFKGYNFTCVEKNEEEYDIDKILGKQIMTHLQTFFNTSLLGSTYNTTKKNSRINRNNKTKRQK